MDLHDRQPRGGLRGCIVGFMLTLAASLLCVGATTATIDFECQQRFSNNLPIYPGAEVVAHESQYMQHRNMELWVDAPPAEVRDWYNRTIGMARRSDLQNRQAPATAWRGEFTVAAASDGEGSRVFLSVLCT